MTPRRDRRAEILVTAARLFAESGFHGVSIDDLGAELGISGPALYRYFPGKEAILAEMLLDISQRLLDGANVRVDELGAPELRLSALIDFHIAFALGEPDLIAVQFRDLGSVPEPQRRTIRQLQRAYVSAWVSVVQQVYPAVTVVRAQSCAQAMFGLLNSTPHSGRSGEGNMARLLHSIAAAALAAGCVEE